MRHSIALKYPRINIFHFRMTLSKTVRWRKIKAENLDLDYGVIMGSAEAKNTFLALEDEINYFDKDLAKVHIFGKWHPIPRKQVGT